MVRGLVRFGNELDKVVCVMERDSRGTLHMISQFRDTCVTVQRSAIHSSWHPDSGPGARTPTVKSEHLCP
jgi:hypothetical protein